MSIPGYRDRLDFGMYLNNKGAADMLFLLSTMM